MLEGIIGSIYEWYFFADLQSKQVLVNYQSTIFSGISRLNNQTSYIDLGTTGYKTTKKYIKGKEDPCNIGFYFQPLCFNWEEIYLIQETNNQEKTLDTTGNIWYFGDGYIVMRYMRLLNYSTDKKLIILLRNNFYAYDYANNKYAKLYDYTDKSYLEKVLYFE